MLSVRVEPEVIELVRLRSMMDRCSREEVVEAAIRAYVKVPEGMALAWRRG